MMAATKRQKRCLRQQPQSADNSQDDISIVVPAEAQKIDTF